ncbi:MAG TPA: molybdopterin-binding protein [Polyangiaceae bacterium]|nr:molybdopterin-binding protein [Polyangiaceae bacterium]
MNAADAPRTAAALVIGNELLSGKVRDENVVELARLLRRLGVDLRRVLMVPDEPELIAREVAELSRDYTFVFTSGGVGPTHDDVTIASVAAAFGLEVGPHPALEKLLRDHYRERLTEGHLAMARAPVGARLLQTDDVRWPVTVVENVWVLPGVPEIFRMKLAVVAAHLGVDRPYVSRAAYTNLDEGTLKPLLDRVVADHPEVAVGSYPTWSDPSYRTKLTFDGKDAAEVGRAFDAFLATLPAGEPQRTE